MTTIYTQIQFLLTILFLISPSFEIRQQPGTTQTAQGNLPTPRSIWVTEWSPDGKYFALGGDDSTLWIYEANNYTLHATLRMNSVVRGLSWHPKENILAIANANGAQLLHVKSGELRTIPNLKTGGRGIAWNPSGELLALADGRGLVQLMNKDGKILQSIPKHNNHSYLTLDWHPTKNIIVTGSDEIILFDTEGKQLQFIKHRKEHTGVLSARWHPSGEFFASGDYGHEKEGMPTLLQFWNEDGSLIKTLTGHHAEIRNLRWNKNGNLLATASDALRIWNKNGDLLYTGESKEILWGIAWSPDGTRIVTGSFANGKVKLWNNQAKLIKEIN